MSIGKILDTTQALSLLDGLGGAWWYERLCYVAFLARFCLRTCARSSALRCLLEWASWDWFCLPSGVSAIETCFAVGAVPASPFDCDRRSVNSGSDPFYARLPKAEPHVYA